MAEELKIQADVRQVRGGYWLRKSEDLGSSPSLGNLLGFLLAEWVSGCCVASNLKRWFVI